VRALEHGPHPAAQALELGLQPAFIAILEKADAVVRRANYETAQGTLEPAYRYVFARTRFLPASFA